MLRHSLSAALLAAGICAVPLATASAAEPAMTGKTSAGQALVNAKGMTLYTFDKDSSGKSACNGGCAANWPPLMAKKGAKAMGEYSVVTRDDGSAQWAYDGKPLYTFIKDKKAGDAKGDGLMGVWHVAKPD